MTTLLSKGGRYMIRNRTLGGKPVEEGIAALRTYLGSTHEPDSEIWDVEFEEEPGARFRRIVLVGDRIS